MRFEIETIDGARFKIEHVKRTKRYCTQQMKCMKGAGNHHTKGFTKIDIRTTKCANGQRTTASNNNMRKQATREVEQQLPNQQHQRILV